jgi:hypothetical protein
VVATEVALAYGQPEIAVKWCSDKTIENVGKQIVTQQRQTNRASS